MIADTPTTLLLSLLIISIIALAMGYCLGLLRTKKQLRQIIDGEHFAIEQSKHEVDNDLEAARANIERLQNSLSFEAGKIRSAAEREQALDSQAQVQIQRIQELEAQCAVYEEQQIRAQRDFATFKANKNRELELARLSFEVGGSGNELPTLSERAKPIAEELRLQAPVYIPNLEKGTQRLDSPKKLDAPLSKDLEIPALSESELPDMVDDLDLNIPEGAGNGAGVQKSG